ncbi:hypothetical protein CLOM_g12191 [Closterium sp. NIES-68]|nr:hypothetical protein CLOM_g12191 [Closterium sp. NIES-68]GJP72120.1 hypothetical protein CLOP_g2884 [Closterium sp. NIES-67]
MASHRSCFLALLVVALVLASIHSASSLSQDVIRGHWTPSSEECKLAYTPQVEDTCISIVTRYFGGNPLSFAMHNGWRTCHDIKDFEKICIAW